MHGSATAFGHLFFRVLPTLNSIKKACCKVVMANQKIDIYLDEIVDVVGHVDVS
jgi:hypothetical protein